MAKYRLDYIWLDGYTPVPNLRTKCCIKEFDEFPPLEQLPEWGFDGSSTQQADGGDSDCVLKPVDEGLLLEATEVSSQEIPQELAARKAKAAESKAEANELFAAGDSRSAVISYLAGIWFLKRGAELPCPAVIVSRSEALDGAVDGLAAQHLGRRPRPYERRQLVRERRRRRQYASVAGAFGREILGQELPGHGLSRTFLAAGAFLGLV